jgi:hypothetical protein
MAVELDEDDDVAHWGVRLSVLPRWHDPLRLGRGGDGQRSPSLTRSHSQRFVTIDGHHPTVDTRVTGIAAQIGSIARRPREVHSSVSLSLSLTWWGRRKKLGGDGRKQKWEQRV